MLGRWELLGFVEAFGVWAFGVSDKRPSMHSRDAVRSVPAATRELGALVVHSRGADVECAALVPGRGFGKVGVSSSGIVSTQTLAAYMRP